MVRKYTRTYRNLRKGIRFMPYFSYTTDDLNKALSDVKSKKMTTREAEEKYGVPKSTINRRLKEKNILYSRPGHPTLFSEVEETTFVNYVKHMGEWGFPLDLMDLRVFAQKYLSKIGRTVYSLKDNLPGRDWAVCFLQRHKNEISNRYAANISSDRATLSSEVIDIFFEHYEKNLEDITPDCVINYDETNLTDDPGSKKYIFKRGKKYPERVINNSKSSVSLMFSGTASGLLLPTYVVYKAEHLYDTWILGGPENTRYNKSKSGWFDSLCFEDWFQTVIIPYAKTKEGKKILLIGDNLSSHFSSKVLEQCEKHNITFVCLPPKATHILQPLDVAFFAPLKHYWRTILTDWKKGEGRKCKTLAKNSFPGLLRKLLNMLHAEDAALRNLKSGFAKCGLLPVDKNRPKERLPLQMSDENIQSNVSGVMMEMLEDIRGCTGEKKITRKKRCNVPAGQSIKLADITNTEKETNNKKKGKGKGKGKKTRPVTKSSVEVLPTVENDSQLSCELYDHDFPKTAILTEKDIGGSDKKLSNKGKGKGQGKGKITLLGTEKCLEVSTTDSNKTRPCQNIKHAFSEASIELSTKNTTSKKINAKERKNWRQGTSETSSSDSDIEISTHSDSDLLDVSDDILQCFDQSPFHQEIPSPVSFHELFHEINSNQQIKPLSATPLTYNTPGILELKDTQQNGTPVSQDNEITDLGKRNEPVPGSSREIEVVDYNYDVGTSVLVRYILKKKVEYFVGHILSKSGSKYTISFLKKTGRSDNTRFIKSKKLDIDTVNVDMIIKEVELLTLNEKRTEFMFLNDEDIFFFEY